MLCGDPGARCPSAVPVMKDPQAAMRMCSRARLQDTAQTPARDTAKQHARPGAQSLLTHPRATLQSGGACRSKNPEQVPRPRTQVQDSGSGASDADRQTGLAEQAVEHGAREGLRSVVAGLWAVPCLVQALS